jgi:hypothetical protein
MKAEIRANNEKFEVFHDTLAFWMNIHQVRTESTQEQIKAKMDIHQEKMEVAIHCIQTIKQRVEDVLSCVDQKK